MRQAFMTLARRQYNKCILRMCRFSQGQPHWKGIMYQQWEYWLHLTQAESLLVPTTCFTTNVGPMAVILRFQCYVFPGF